MDQLSARVMEYFALPPGRRQCGKIYLPLRTRRSQPKVEAALAELMAYE
jgi:hypothetical protein